MLCYLEIRQMERVTLRWTNSSSIFSSIPFNTMYFNTYDKVRPERDRREDRRHQLPYLPYSSHTALPHPLRGWGRASLTMLLGKYVRSKGGKGVERVTTTWSPLTFHTVEGIPLRYITSFYHYVLSQGWITLTWNGFATGIMDIMMAIFDTIGRL